MHSGKMVKEKLESVPMPYSVKIGQRNEEAGGVMILVGGKYVNVHPGSAM